MFYKDAFKVSFVLRMLQETLAVILRALLCKEQSEFLAQLLLKELIEEGSILFIAHRNIILTAAMQALFGILVEVAMEDFCESLGHNI